MKVIVFRPRQLALRQSRHRQRGAVAILFAIVLIIMIAIMGFALDLARLYNRNVELQSVADAAALTAASSLSGTSDGIDAAVAAAATAAADKKFSYEKSTVAWSDSALKFSSSPTGGNWMDAGAARAAPGGIVFVKVDTAELGVRETAIETMLIRVLDDSLATVSTSTTSVAGRSMINVTPLAICAMSSVPAEPRPPSGELVQYGFRRGVAYDLMNLNSEGTSAANFVVNPIDAAGMGAASSNTGPDVVGPFVCAGAMPMVKLTNGQIGVRSPFPIAALADHLNSRFGQYNNGACNYRAAPPDLNIKSYLYTAGNSWMKTMPTGQGATQLIVDDVQKKRITVADPVPLPGTNTASSYGVLWSYARPVPFSEYVAGEAEPESGYIPFAKAAWPALYAPGLPEAKNSYPPSTPYMSGGSANHLPPNSLYGRGLRQRRVLNVPLLDCPVSSGASVSATVLAIGRFFMTVPATTSSIHAEFVGIASEQTLGGTVELYK